MRAVQQGSNLQRSLSLLLSVNAVCSLHYIVSVLIKLVWRRCALAVQCQPIYCCCLTLKVEYCTVVFALRINSANKARRSCMKP